MMTKAVEQALGLWGMDGSVAELAAQRENKVWRVTHNGERYALRFHRPGYRSADELRSELQWMGMLARGGLSVPVPIAMPDGGLIAQIGDHHVSLLTWLAGRPIGATGTLHDIADPVALCRTLGRDMARLHDLSDAWMPPAGFTRPDWLRDELLGEQPLWGRFWDHPHLSAQEKTVLLRARDAANAALSRIEGQADRGLIHADLLGENIMISDAGLSFIDFDDGVFGFRDFELATFLVKFLDAPGYSEMRTALCDGYATRRRIDPDDLDLFLLLRALTYPGWIIDRMDEPGGADRSARLIKMALRLADEFLKRRKK
jgi:Ser/Thr protein kinase RdoA (MazF antagonist)